MTVSMFILYHNMLDVYTHRPDTSSECHGVGNSTSYAGRTKGEIIISHLSSCVSPQWTVTSIVIMRGSSITETESKIIVTLTALWATTPKWYATASSIPLTAIASTVLVVAVSVGVRSDFKYVIAFCKLWDQESKQLRRLQCCGHKILMQEFYEVKLGLSRMRYAWRLIVVDHLAQRLLKTDKTLLARLVCACGGACPTLEWLDTYSAVIAHALL